MQQDRGPEAPTCPRCGAATTGAGCPDCPPPRRGSLWVLPGGLDRAETGPPPAPPVRLVREWKGPTVRDVLAAQDAAVEPLPGRVHAVAERVRAGDFAGAERRLDDALATLLPGPGSRPRPRRPRWILWCVAGAGLALAGAAVWAWLR